MSGSIVVTFFRDYAATTKTELQSIALHDLARRIETTTASAKGWLPWLKLARFGDRPTDANCLRWNGNLLAFTGVEADYDAELIGFDTVVETLGAAGICCIIYTSPSHTEDTPRWRVLAFFSREYPPGQRDRFLSRLNGLLGGIVSNESWTLSQSYYFGSVKRNPSHRVVVLDGVPIDQMDELDAIAIGKPTNLPDPTVRPVYPAADLSQITSKRLAGKLRSLLANISNASVGDVHYALLRNSTTVGGYAWLLPYSDEELLGMLLNALPPDDHPDPKNERQTAIDGLKRGRAKPLTLEERPYEWRRSA